MSGYEPQFDQHGNPVLYDVSAYHTLEGVIGAPVGTWLTREDGRRFQVKPTFPLSPRYVAERDALTLQKERIRRARLARKAQQEAL